MQLDNPLWQFSLSIWKNEVIREGLLKAQDGQGLDITATLFALWCAHCKIDLYPAQPECASLIATYNKDFVVPLRQARRKASANAQLNTLKQTIQAAELSAEQHLLAALFALSNLLQNDLRQDNRQSSHADSDVVDLFGHNLRLIENVSPSDQLVEALIQVLTQQETPT